MHFAITASFLFLLCSVIFEFLEGKKRVRVNALVAEAKQLRRQAKPLNTPATFAQCAKLQRAAAAKEKEAANVFKETSQGRVAALCKAATTLRDLLSVLILLKSFWSPVVVLPGPGLGFGFDTILGLGSGYRAPEAGAAATGGAGGGAANAGATVAVGTFAYLWLLNKAAGPLGRLAAAGAERLLDSKVGCASAIAMEEEH